MTFSPYQHVPGTPSLNIVSSFNTKQVGLLCATPEQSVPRTPCSALDRSARRRNANSCTPLLTPSWTPLANVPSDVATPHQRTSNVDETASFTRRLSQKTSSCLSKLKLKKSPSVKKGGQDVRETFVDFHIVPDIAWIGDSLSDMDKISVLEKTPKNLRPLERLPNDSGTDENTLLVALDEDIWG